MTKPIECTLFDLIQSVNQCTDNDREVAATVAALVNSGKVRLRGKFAGAKIDMSPSFSDFPDETLWPLLPSLPTTLPDAERVNQDVRQDNRLAA